MFSPEIADRDALHFAWRIEGIARYFGKVAWIASDRIARR
jgi:hypothetical protein